MGPTRIKICGMTRPDDARDAARAGADAIGLVFHQASARAVDAEVANAVIATLPPFVNAIGLFLDAEPEWVRTVLETVPLDELQFHGRESAAYCRAYGRPYIKALGMGAEIDLAAEAAHYADARALLVDSHAPGQSGGTGEAFGWERLPAQRNFGLVLAGGLQPDNVAEAVARVRPDAVDVSSGVEASPGRKDAGRMHEFIEEVRRGDRNRG